MATKRTSGARRAPRPETFEAFLERREAVSRTYISGDPGPLRSITTTKNPATFFPPNGARVRGAKAVIATNAEGAKAFAEGSTGRFEILQSGSSGDLGFWTGIQHAEVRLQGKRAPVRMELRTTEVFRREGGAWKLVHRHADMKATS